MILGALETKCRLPALVVALAQFQLPLLLIYRSAVVDESVVGPLEGDPRSRIYKQAAPSVVVGHQWRPTLSIDRKLIDIPDAVKWGLWCSAAVLAPRFARAVGGQADEQQSIDGLHDDGREVHACG